MSFTPMNAVIDGSEASLGAGPLRRFFVVIFPAIRVSVLSGAINVLLLSLGEFNITLLRTIGGLEEKSGGDIYFYEKEISDVPVEERNVGFVFQNYALFPTMTVRNNIAFGLKLRKMDKNETLEELAKGKETLLANVSPLTDQVS